MENSRIDTSWCLGQSLTSKLDQIIKPFKDRIVLALAHWYNIHNLTTGVQITKVSKIPIKLNVTSFKVLFISF